jgi:hypothetical protein
MFIFNLNVVFTMNFLKMTLIRVCFCPGFPPGAGFPGEEFAPAWLYTVPKAFFRSETFQDFESIVSCFL